MLKCAREEDGWMEGKKELFFCYVKFGIPLRHPGGDVNSATATVYMSPEFR